MKTYMLIVTDDRRSQNFQPIITDDLKVEFIGIGQSTLGKHYQGQRYNVIVNRSGYYDLRNTEDEYARKWFNECLLAFAAKDVKIHDGVDR